MKCKPSIAIIGAGLAGLPAELRLMQKNYDVTIFEASSRVGGRIFTVLMKRDAGEYLNVELGGHNIRVGGLAKNIIALAKELECEIIDEIAKFENSYVFFNHQYFEIKDLIDRSFKNSNEIDSIIDTLASTCTSMNELIDH